MFVLKCETYKDAGVVRVKESGSRVAVKKNSRCRVGCGTCHVMSTRLLSINRGYLEEHVRSRGSDKINIDKTGDFRFGNMA
jgi:hypothetical protein